MIIVKLIVVSCYIIFCECAKEYCLICPNHTLCLYPIPGQSSSCIGYDSSALVTKEDIADIVSRINELRNNVALGRSKNLPQAANMKTVSWSEDLAKSAQRWVDRCHPATRPDKLDSCRDLEKTPVGQNIATILGGSRDLNTKSLVDMWYMQIISYDGNVAFYNQSRDSKSNFFLQLISAQTDSVGCGKARFYIDRKTSAERLVCNFAPRGLAHGKPVYAAGAAATQCPDNHRPSQKYPGLCSFRTNKKDKLFKAPDPPPSLLRIINLTNTSVKQEIDPINNLKPSSVEADLLYDHRHQKSRHVMNNTYPHDMSHFMPQMPNQMQNQAYNPIHNPMHNQMHNQMHNPMHNSMHSSMHNPQHMQHGQNQMNNPMQNSMTNSNNNQQPMHNPLHNQMHSHNHSGIYPHYNQHQPSRGCVSGGCGGGASGGGSGDVSRSGVYHGPDKGPNYQPPYAGHNYRPNYIPPYQVTTEQNFRRYDADQNYRRYDTDQNYRRYDTDQNYRRYDTDQNYRRYDTDQNYRRYDNRYEMITQPSTNTPAQLPETNTETNFRRQYQPNVPDENMGPNYRRHFGYDQCTRFPVPCNEPVPCVANMCTRGLIPPPCPHVVVEPHDVCPCPPPLPPPPPCPPPPPPPPPPPCCEPAPPCYPPCPPAPPPCAPAPYPPCCANHPVEPPLVRDETRKSGGELHYYDLFPNMVKRSGDSTSESPQSKGIFLDKRTWRPQNLALKKEKRVLKDSSTNQNKNKVIDYLESRKDRYNFSSSSLNFRKRRKRQTGEKITLMAPWKKEHKSNTSPAIVKSSRFTTLFNKGNKKNRDTTTDLKTESITLGFYKEANKEKLKKESSSQTEKYLSFDELMHLRKLNKGNLSGRRQAGKTTPKSTKKALRTETEETPMNYTTNTPFQRKKYCTRKLTCTWTAFTATAEDGSLINPGFDIPGGSRTPAGYVEGCTRTSTCTRDFLARNVGTTGTSGKKRPGEDSDDEDDEDDENGEGAGNEEYCERRSLNVQKRNSDHVKTVNKSFQNKNITICSKTTNRNNINSRNHSSNDEPQTTPTSKDMSTTDNDNEYDCNCPPQSAIKKRDIGHYNNNNELPECTAHCDHQIDSDVQNPLMSYGDLYYLVVKKIISSWEQKKPLHNKQCSCNTGSSEKNNGLVTVFLIFSVTLLH